jgi:hypothetical protein
MKNARLALAGLAAALLIPAQALANATVVALKGDARMGNTLLSKGQRVFAGATLNTSQGALLTLKFDDDQQVVLNENTTFRIADFRYRAQEPRSDRAVFDLLRGALRFISGVIGARNPNTVALRAPQMTIGIRGTDFMVAVVNPAFVNVVSGSIAASNTAGTVVFGTGSIGQVASSASLAVPIQATALPPAASGAFANLTAAQVSAAVTPAAAQGASAGAATGSVAAPAAGIGAAIAVGVGAAVIGTAINEEDVATTTTHH